METTNTLTLNSAWNSDAQAIGCNSNLNQGYTTNYNWYDPNTYYPFVNTVYFPYQTFWTNEDRITKSFKLVQKLIEKKLIKEPKTVKDFIELVNSISEVL